MTVSVKGQIKNSNLFKPTSSRNGRNSYLREVKLIEIIIHIEAKGGGFNAKSLDLTQEMQLM